MISQWAARTLGSKPSGGGRSPHAPTASSALPSAVKAWPPGAGTSRAEAAGLVSIWGAGLPSAGLAGGVASAALVPAPSPAFCALPAGVPVVADPPAEGVACGELGEEPAPAFAE